jgi:hypothetical protein
MLLAGLMLNFATFALGLVLAFRLLRLAARRRTAPELAMGLYCLFVTCGALLVAASLRGAPAGSPAVFALSAASTLFVGLAALALAVGIWRIFRPGERWARALVIGVALWMGASWTACVLPGRPVLLGDLTIANGFFVAGRIAVYACGAFEAFRYAAMLRRRVALGLADPVSVNQILLWGIAWVCVAGIAVGAMIAMWLGGREVVGSPITLLSLSTLNAAAWICTWLAFFPPRAYQRWIAAASVESAA